MKFSRPEADIFTSDEAESPEQSLARVTHLCVGAHQDDIEIMAHAGLCDCWDSPDGAFGGVVVTDGASSPRAGAFSDFDDCAMRRARRDEQREAARIGRYSIQIQLAHPSAAVKDRSDRGTVADLAAIFAECRPEVLYVHNPADKHDTHVAVLQCCLDALGRLEPSHRPRRVLGCEVWRDLDWLADDCKVALNSGRRPELAGELLRVFRSQVVGGKRYDLAALGRRSANATFHTSHATDQWKGVTWAMDLTPIVGEGSRALEELVEKHLREFHDNVMGRLKQFAAFDEVGRAVSRS